MTKFATNSFFTGLCLLAGWIHLSEAQDCSSYSNCFDCLNADGCDAWVVGECFPDCDTAPSDTSCYSPSITSFMTLTSDEICAIHDEDKGNYDLCDGQQDCTSCVGTILADGVSTCQWFGNAATPFCGSECGMFGCGETTCSSIMEEEPVAGVDCSTATTCSGCLNMDGCNAWAGMGECFTNCSEGPTDISCYSPEYNEGKTTDEICSQFDEDQANYDLCDSQQDCTSCVGAILADGVSTCQWFGNAATPFCGSECDMFGCGETTCSVNVEEEPTSGVDCSTATTCSECLDMDGCNAWSAKECVADCVSGTSSAICYSPDRFVNKTTTEICSIVEEDEANYELCDSKTDCTSCIESVLADGETTCQWFDLGGGYTFCGSGCGPVGCGETTCPQEPTRDCSTATTCSECLDMDECNAWAGVGECFTNCSEGPTDISCYSPEYNEGKTTNEICSQFDEDQANSDLCSAQSDCTSCVGTTLVDGMNTCQWFDLGENSFCGHECGMIGCGDSTCTSSASSSKIVSTLVLASAVVFSLFL